MSLLGEIARENDVEWFCQKIAKSIDANKNNPEVVKVLKELGLEVLDTLDAWPVWARNWRQQFLT